MIGTTCTPPFKGKGQEGSAVRVWWMMRVCGNYKGPVLPSPSPREGEMTVLIPRRLENLENENGKVMEHETIDGSTLPQDCVEEQLC